MNFLGKIIKGVEVVLIVMFGIMAVLVFGNVVLRYGFNSGIVFSEEASRFMFMWLTLIGALIVMKDHGHLGMSSVVDRLGERGRRVCRCNGCFAVPFGCVGVMLVGAFRARFRRGFGCRSGRYGVEAATGGRSAL